ncbi:MAG: zinc ribbon domain-containing protein [Haloarculaceae archaeon]
MVSEFDLPCTVCGATLSRSTLAEDDGGVPVAVCPDCGSRHYPETALEVLGATRGR